MIRNEFCLPDQNFFMIDLRSTLLPLVCDEWTTPSGPSCSPWAALRRSGWLMGMVTLTRLAGWWRDAAPCHLWTRLSAARAGTGGGPPARNRFWDGERHRAQAVYRHREVRLLSCGGTRLGGAWSLRGQYKWYRGTGLQCVCVVQDFKCTFQMPATRLTEPQGPLVS